MHFRTIFLIITLTELTSLVAQFFPWLNTFGFFIIVVAALALSLKRLEYGLYFVLADLILGGKSGALFSFEYNGFFLSLRMALFIVVMGVWAGKMLLDKTYRTNKTDRTNSILNWWGVLGIAIVWGLIVGLARGNNFGDLFLDANGYFYALMILPFVWSILRMDTNAKYEWTQMLSVVFFAATTCVALETLFLVYFWTHGLNNYIAANLRPIYDWLRDTGVGEVTWLEGNFARVFFQSHIYNVAAFFALLAVFITPPTSPYLKGRRFMLGALLILNTAVIIISLSRSFWVGTLVGLMMLGILIGRTSSIRRIGQMTRTLLIAAVSAVFLLFLIARFPFPRPSDMDLSFLQDRSNITTNTAASRWNLLPVLTKAALEHPIIGSGFGHTVTYISNDPRIREVSVTGEYTTYAFEWGWIDIWLKMGIMGLIGFMGLIGHIGLMLYRRAKTEPIFFVGLAILASLTVIHFFTPYLNHPLGLGVLILMSMRVMMET